MKVQLPFGFMSRQPQFCRCPGQFFGEYREKIQRNADLEKK